MRKAMKSMRKMRSKRTGPKRSKVKRAKATKKKKTKGKKKSSAWNKKVSSVYRELRKTNSKATLGDAMKEASRRRKAGKL